MSDYFLSHEGIGDWYCKFVIVLIRITKRPGCAGIDILISLTK
jgi:hypothetical protein